MEDGGGTLVGFEFKWGKGKVKMHKDFLLAYPGSSIQLVNRGRGPDPGELSGVCEIAGYSGDAVCL